MIRRHLEGIGLIFSLRLLRPELVFNVLDVGVDGDFKLFKFKPLDFEGELRLFDVDVT